MTFFIDWECLWSWLRFRSAGRNATIQVTEQSNHSLFPLEDCTVAHLCQQVQYKIMQKELSVVWGQDWEMSTSGIWGTLRQAENFCRVWHSRIWASFVGIKTTARKFELTSRLQNHPPIWSMENGTFLNISNKAKQIYIPVFLYAHWYPDQISLIPLESFNKENGRLWSTCYLENGCERQKVSVTWFWESFTSFYCRAKN